MTNTTDFREMTEALYRVVSAPSGARDWSAVRRYYHPDARLVRTGVNPDGTPPFALVMSLDAYIENVEALLKEIRFSEVELTHGSGGVWKCGSSHQRLRSTRGNRRRSQYEVGASISSRSFARMEAGAS